MFLSVISVVETPFKFKFLFIWILFSLVSLIDALSIMCIFSKNEVLVLLVFSVFLFFVPNLYFVYQVN